MELKATSYELRGRTAVIFLDRPERGNAWTGRMDTEYRWLLDQADNDPDVRVIVVAGSGERFCVGGDSQALEGHVEKGGYDRGLSDEQANPGYGVHPHFDQPLASHMGLSKPTIAAVQGAAAGIGLSLVCFCDLRFASPGTKFTTAHGKLGLPPEYGASWLLPRIVGTTRAMELLLTSRVFTAEEALDMGFLNRIVEADQLLDTAVDYAESLASNVAPTSLRETRRQVYLDLHRDVGSSVSDSLRLIDEMMSTPEYRQGVKALVERRPPDF
ncbi:MAG: enoyl-CoA hydratase-related protein [Actinomycetota bacterium]